MLNGSFSNYVPDCLRGMPPPRWVRQAGHPGLCSAYLSWVMSKPWLESMSASICLRFSLPLLLTFTPFFATLQRCLLPSFPSADIRGCSYFCAGAGSREPGLPPSAHGPAWPVSLPLHPSQPPWDPLLPSAQLPPHPWVSR